MRFITDSIAGNTLLWKVFLRLVFKPANRARQARKEVLQKRLLQRLGPDLIVANGPFEGMKYPSAESHGSKLLPKLLGTYESELSGYFESWRNTPFHTIVDIGCAEGYYAVGLARLFPQSSIVAFDIADVARRLTKEMAELNHVAHRMQVRKECNREELLRMNLDNGGLIVSDCEGYELELFDAEVADHLRHCHVVIEMHDRPHKDFFVRPVLEAIFSETHRVKIVNSIPLIQQVKTYQSQFVSKFDDIEREAAFEEKRPRIMYWLVAEPNQGPDSRNE